MRTIREDRCQHAGGRLERNFAVFGATHDFRFISSDEYRAALETVGFTVTYRETTGRTYRSGQEYFEFISIVGEKLGKMGGLSTSLP